MPYLVSLCNLGPWMSRYPLAVVEDDFRSAAFVDCDAFMLPDADAGITGMAFFEQDLLLCIQSTMPRLVRLDQGFGVRVVYPLSEIGDPHSICMDGRQALIAASRRNCIYALDLDTGEERCRFVVDPEDADTVHVNAVAKWQGQLVVSMLGERVKEGVRHGRLALESGDVLADGLRDPHTLTVTQQGLLVLESASGRLLRIDPDNGGQPEALGSFDGYLRGMCVRDGITVIGASAWRHRPLPATPAGAANRSALIAIDAAARQVASMDFAPFGAEIYDVVHVPDQPPSTSVFVDAVERRADTVLEARRRQSL